MLRCTLSVRGARSPRFRCALCEKETLTRCSATSPVSNKIITPDDIGFGIVENHGVVLSVKATTMFVFLLLLDFYRTAVRNSGDSAFTYASWTQEFHDITFTVQPARGGGMRHAHAVFSIMLIWLWMSGLVDLDPSQTGGFFERNYVILKHGSHPVHEYGVISFESTPDSNSG